MTDYVKRSDVINSVCKFCKDQHADELCDEWDICQLFTRISNVPSADVIERKRGRWKDEKIRGDLRTVCSCCGEESGALYEFSYCPNCGAKMENAEC